MLQLHSFEVDWWDTINLYLPDLRGQVQVGYQFQILNAYIHEIVVEAQDHYGYIGGSDNPWIPPGFCARFTVAHIDNEGRIYYTTSGAF